MSNAGNVTLITGAGSGMGQLAARNFARQGITVAALDINEAGLAKTAEGLDKIRTYKVDITDYAAVSRVVDEVEQQLGAIGRVFNCAAIMPLGKLLEQDVALQHKIMAINYGGTVNLVGAVMPAMVQAGRGQIVLFGSIAGAVLAPHLGAYCASKAATNAFAEILIEETRGSGVHMMLVCPPMVNTPLLKQAEEASNPKNIQMAKDQNRLATPEFIIGQVEKGLAKGTEILVPGAEAKIMMLWRRWMPGLLWKVIHWSMK